MLITKPSLLTLIIKRSKPDVKQHGIATKKFETETSEDEEEDDNKNEEEEIEQKNKTSTY